MSSNELVKKFYEEIVSSNLVSEVQNFVSKDCLLRIGEERFPFGVEDILLMLGKPILILKCVSLINSAMGIMLFQK